MPRPARSNRRVKGGIISKKRAVWTDVVLGTFAILVHPEPETLDLDVEGYKREAGNDVILEVPGPGDSYVSLDLTRLTSRELDYVEAVFARVIAMARPIVERRDHDAELARERGDDIYSRIYRQVPNFFVRAGNE